MKHLIEIKNKNGKQVVSARELYEFLGYNSSQWKRWYTKNIVNDDFFEENTDYQTLDIMSNGNATKDFALSIDMAKELSMLSRTLRGKQARTYFIQIEKKYSSTNRIADPMELVIQIAQNSIDLRKKQEAIEQDVSEIKEDLKVLKEKNETNPNFFTVVGYATLLGRKINLEFAKKIGKEASKICRERNIEPSTIPDPRFGRVKTYPKEILESIIKQ
ncbi:antA/AntB antirepressor family protein [Aquimarina hainanensis]|uniref:AntA/AntB antirepressor family protein n=1 Tax=Aquimarina hainanensis TaxID=1578017 RepID=A0ABW5NB20_9FLAO